MKSRSRFILDTNVLISAFLFTGLPHQAFLKAQREGVILASEATLAELQEVLMRSKFDRAADRALREAFVQAYARSATVVAIHSAIRACRDPRDNKFLELAVDGHAGTIITGDGDLLALQPFHGIAILTPTQFLEQAEGSG